MIDNLRKKNSNLKVSIVVETAGYGRFKFGVWVHALRFTHAKHSACDNNLPCASLPDSAGAHPCSGH